MYGSSFVNGVAAIHSEILKADVFKEWHAEWPEKFQNKTNGITQRRWLGLCNPELCALLDDTVGEGYLTDLFKLDGLKDKIDDALAERFMIVKREKKRQLAAIIREKEGVALPEHFIFSVQVKRLHEYKRQLLNALSIWDIYQSLLDGSLSDFPATAFIFGAKSAPGYARAKAVIRFINRIAAIINADTRVNDRLRVVFVQNYNCSYAEHIIPAADISEQISPAGTEASGTGNMKLMLNGAVTLGTCDGANIEIFEQAGAENNYPFGATVEELNAMLASHGTAPVATGFSLAELIRRPQISYADTAPFDPARPKLPKAVTEQAEIRLKYDGYIKRQLKQVEEFTRMEERALPADIDYSKVTGLRIEAREKLEKIRPVSFGQASRISGVSPADISVLMVYMESRR